MKVKIRRHWNDWRIAEVDFTMLSNIAWDRYSGGVNVPAPKYFIHAYIWCDEYKGELAHSCQYGKGQHNIKICITKNDYQPSVLAKIKNEAGTKPRYVKQSSVGDSIQ
jgi:hypothetical protein